MSITHTFVSPIADAGDPSIVGPNAWNADHALQETGGPTNLSIGAIADAQFIKRSGTTLIGASVSIPVLSVFGRTGAVAAASNDYSHSMLSGIGSSDHHSRYADSEAVSAMGIKGDTNPLNHDKYTNAQASAAAPVQSVFGRVGTVVAAINDYTWAQIDKTVSSIADITTRTHSLLGTLTADDHTQYTTHARMLARSLMR